MRFEIEEIVRKARRLDFRSSSGGFQDVTSLYAGGELMFNAAEFVGFHTHGFHIQVCQECGTPQCAPGCWGNLRKIGPNVVFIPAVVMMRSGDWERREYSPPTFMSRLGIPTFSRTIYAELAAEIDSLPSWESIEDINSLEALAIHQMSAPGQILGKLGQPARLSVQHLIAVTEGDLEVELEALRQLLDRIEAGEPKAFCLHPDQSVQFHLDLPSFPTWTGFCYNSGKPALSLAPFS